MTFKPILYIITLDPMNQHPGQGGAMVSWSLEGALEEAKSMVEMKAILPGVAVNACANARELQSLVEEQGDYVLYILHRVPTGTAPSPFAELSAIYKLTADSSDPILSQIRTIAERVLADKVTEKMMGSGK